MFNKIIHNLFWIIALAFLMLIGSGTLLAQNIVTNSGFEAGKIGELPDEWLDQEEGGAEGSVILTNKTAHSGKQSLLIEQTNDEGYTHPNKSVEIQLGDYAFSFWAKSDKEIGFPAQIYSEKDWNVLFDTSCSLKKSIWTKFDFPVSFTEQFTGSIQIGLTSHGRLWLDDVKLTKKSETLAVTNIKIWDTTSPIQDLKSKVKDRIGWKPFSKDALLQGDMVFENGYIIVAFCSKLGEVIVYSKSGQMKAEIIPIQLKDKEINVTDCKVLQNTDDKTTIEVVFSANETNIPVTFSLSKKQTIEIKSNKSGMCIFSPIEYGIIPSFISDDLIFDPKDYYSKETLYLPSENLFLGLLSGKDSMLFIIMPDKQMPDEQDIRLILDKNQTFKSVEVENKDIYLSLLEAPGIWHKEPLKPNFLESDIPINNWKRPFPAKWITELYEDGVKTTYTFKDSEPKTDDFWRAAVGWYKFPVWFTGEKAFFHLCKKVPPKGDAIIYFLERKGTPVSVSTPVDIIKEALEPQICDKILDPAGRRHRSLTRPDSTIDTATCAVTNGILHVFEAGDEVQRSEYVKGGTEDMIYFLFRENERAMEYQAFADDMLKFLKEAKKENPDQATFLDKMESITRELISAYENEKENLKDMDYAKKLADETIALTQKKSPDNLSAFKKLKEEWTGMGGSVDDLNRILHSTTRKLFQEAGYGCVDQLKTVSIAEDIRKMTIKCLRNPGSYEIWSDY
jgi:hypothetical protein